MKACLTYLPHLPSQPTHCSSFPFLILQLTVPSLCPGMYSLGPCPGVASLGSEPLFHPDLPCVCYAGFPNADLRTRYIAETKLPFSHPTYHVIKLTPHTEDSVFFASSYVSSPVRDSHNGNKRVSSRGSDDANGSVGARSQQKIAWAHQ